MNAFLGKGQALRKNQETGLLRYLSHHGIKGQRWGVRRTKAALSRASKREGRQESAEAKKAKELGKKKRSELTNDELRFLNDRQSLEQNHARLNPNAVQKGENKTKAVLATVGIGVAAFNTIKSPAGQAAIKAGQKAVKKLLSTGAALP